MTHTKLQLKIGGDSLFSIQCKTLGLRSSMYHSDLRQTVSTHLRRQKALVGFQVQRDAGCFLTGLAEGKFYLKSCKRNPTKPGELSISQEGLGLQKAGDTACQTRFRRKQAIDGLHLPLPEWTGQNPATEAFFSPFSNGPNPGESQSQPGSKMVYPEPCFKN